MASNPKHNRNLAFKTLDPIEPSLAYDTFWRYAYERQEVFFNRLRSTPGELTNNVIIKKYKFTNVYRACDRVSQYLIRDVIYSHDFCVRDLFLRIVLFKLFNEIETWEFLEQKFGTIYEESFDVEKFRKALDDEMNSGRVLYSNAYMMASGCKEFDVTRKHHAHLKLLDKMLKDCLPEKIQGSRSMKSAYGLLLSYPLIGPFLAYQYITDINYSEICDFSENEFVVPGPGARDGIRKCFKSTGGVTEAELLKIIAERQECEFQRLGLDFRMLDGRRLQFIDIQNIFCETDKYCRVAHPDISGISGRTRIKQLYRKNDIPIDYFFPPKWGIRMEKIIGHRHISS